jgi:hypothetical protein
MFGVLCRDRITARDALKHPFLTQGIIRRASLYRGESAGIDRSGSVSPAAGRSAAAAGAGTHRPIALHVNAPNASVQLALAPTPRDPSEPGLYIQTTL